MEPFAAVAIGVILYGVLTWRDHTKDRRKARKMRKRRERWINER